MFRSLTIAALLIPNFAHAENFYQLKNRGYDVVWSGYAPITTCVHDKNHYKLGSYVFLCDKYTYEYPYHYGDTALLTDYSTSYICMDGQEECIEGSILKR